MVNKDFILKKIVDFELQRYLKGTGYEYDGNVFVAWVLQVL